MEKLTKGLKVVKNTYRKIKDITEFLPRYHCAKYCHDKNGDNYILLLRKEDFETLRIENNFKDGPYMETFGDKNNHPQNNERQAYGRLQDNNLVYCELNKENNEKICSIFNSLELTTLDLN